MDGSGDQVEETEDLACFRCGVTLNDGDPVFTTGPKDDRRECHQDCARPGADTLTTPDLRSLREAWVAAKVQMRQAIKVEDVARKAYHAAQREAATKGS